MTRISVCMATYNGEAFLQRQLESISEQLSASDEIIISDDGSDDSTMEIIRNFSRHPVRFFEHCGPRGITANFNNALVYARGRYIFLSDQDDIWNPGKVDTFLESLSRGILVLSDCEVIDGEGKTVEPSLFKRQNIGKRGFWCNLYKNSYTGCAMAFRRDLLKTALPLPQKVPMYDWWLGLMAELSGRVEIVNQPLVQYRVHGKNASPTGTGSDYPICQRMVFRVRMLVLLFRRLCLQNRKKDFSNVDKQA